MLSLDGTSLSKLGKSERENLPDERRNPSKGLQSERCHEPASRGHPAPKTICLPGPSQDVRGMKKFGALQINKCQSQAHSPPIRGSSRLLGDRGTVGGLKIILRKNEGKSGGQNAVISQHLDLNRGAMSYPREWSSRENQRGVKRALQRKRERKKDMKKRAAFDRSPEGGLSESAPSVKGSRSRKKNYNVRSPVLAGGKSCPGESEGNALKSFDVRRGALDRQETRHGWSTSATD